MVHNYIVIWGGRIFGDCGIYLDVDVVCDGLIGDGLTQGIAP